MVERTIVIQWNDSARGFADHLNERAFTGAPASNFEHRVIGPRGGEHFAKCELRLNGQIADLDYRKFADFNTRRGMTLGVLRIVFTSTTRDAIGSLKWREPASKTFEPAEATFVLICRSRSTREPVPKEQFARCCVFPLKGIHRLVALVSIITVRVAPCVDSTSASHTDRPQMVSFTCITLAHCPAADALTKSIL